MPAHRFPIFSLAVVVSLLSASTIKAAGLYRDGASARSMALGGTSTAEVRNPVDALFGNPATLSSIAHTTIDLSLNAGFLRGSFDNRDNDHFMIRDEGLLGSLAVAIPVGPVRFGFGVNPDIALRDRWRYRDTPGGADGATTYGMRAQESEIILLRTALGASWQVTPQFSVGASVGLLYNKNQLNAPYIFQSQPVLRSVKTLLDLDTDGYGWNVQVGMVWKPVEALQIGLSYASQAKIVTDGRASGNADVQLTNLGLGAARSDFAYDAEVTNVFPQQVSLGLAWHATPKLTLSAQLDWINWQDSFDTLEVRLRNGNNRDLNGLVGSDKLDDDIPLDWRDQFVIRAGVEYGIDDHWTLRAGYAYGRNPVPARTLTPLTAAIMEHTLCAGVGFRQGRVSVDLAYQWQIPNSVDVGESDLAAGEYADSTVRVSTQWVGLTTSLEF
jgi:long-chain fatty acid transport protein